MFNITLSFSQFGIQKTHFQLYDCQNESLKTKQLQRDKQPIHLVTTKIRQLLQFTQTISVIPRTLTQPNAAVYNDGLDNENYDLIIRLDDIIINEKTGNQYIAKELLGVGTFGSVYRCVKNNSNFAIKIIKNINAYNIQAMKEIKLIRFLNKKQEHQYIIKLIDYFLFKNHVCIVFPLLGFNLEELLQETKYQGLSLNMIKNILKQLISGLEFLHSLNWVHCDIKPENILFTDNTAKQIQIIDFGSASELNVNLYYYIQSLYYRAPEIILGYKKTCAIDMWSVGCVAAQLYLGYPLFQGTSSFDQLSKILGLISITNQELIQNSPKFNDYFIKENQNYVLKHLKKYENEQTLNLHDPGIQNITNIQELYLEFNKSSLRTIQEMATMEDFVDLLKKLLEFDPVLRITASQCLQHPFLRDFQFNINDILKQDLQYQ
ncbi:unnamed protein product [Paramecium primaurelia]|uniref:Protein kinase domain-containing protein n=1 Tax=Paramecium primaurelia TaxID=5886 RepID=A0A8S1K3H2_PARPR|nr:unnamed protein product [Paramecium primaurelia]